MASHTARLADELDELGLWSHLPAQRRRRAHAYVADGGYPFKLGWLRDWVFVDAAVMEEGRGEQVLTELAPILSRHGLQLKATTVHEDADIVLKINGISCRITDTVDNPRPATFQPFGIVNHLLARVGASARLHLLTQAPITAWRTSSVPRSSKRSAAPVPCLTTKSQSWSSLTSETPAIDNSARPERRRPS